MRDALNGMCADCNATCVAEQAAEDMEADALTLADGQAASLAAFQLEAALAAAAALPAAPGAAFVERAAAGILIDLAQSSIAAAPMPVDSGTEVEGVSVRPEANREVFNTVSNAL